MTSNPFLQPPDPNSIAPGSIVNGRYRLPHPHTGKPHDWTRTTNFIHKIADTFYLDKWEKRQLITGLVMREDLYIEACGTDLEDKEALEDIAHRAKEVAGGNTGARLGTALHSFTERAKRGEETRAPKKWQGKVDVYLNTLRQYQLIPRVELLERRVVCLRYNLAGTFDDALLVPGHGLVVGDTKSAKEFYTYCDPAMQLGVYANADLMWNAQTCSYEDMPPFNKEIGILIHVPARSDVDVAAPHWVDIKRGWEKLELASAVYEWQKAGKRKNEVGGIYVANPVVITEAYARRIRDAASLDDLSALWDEITGFAYCKPELQDAMNIRRSELVSSDLVSTVDTVLAVN